MKTSSVHRRWCRSVTRFIAAGAVLGAASASQATILVTTDPGQIAAFLSGMTIENFDDLNALTITDYTQQNTTFVFSSRQPNNTPTFDTGGATPSNPASNPGAPVGVYKPSGGIAAEVKSSGNVVGPVLPADFANPQDPPFTAFGLNFMEVAMPAGKNAQKIGLFVTHGPVDVQVQDDGLQQIEGQQNIPTGSFIGFSFNSAVIRNVSIVATTGNSVFTIDDFAYAFTATGNGNGNGGGGGNTVPDTGSTLNLALAACFVGLVARRFGKTQRC